MKLLPLEPPYTRSGPQPWEPTPVVAAAPLVRTRQMTRWHRPRCGEDYGSHVALTLWCGQNITAAKSLTADTPPPGEPTCATCEGRAVGAGHPPLAVVVLSELLFEPVSQYKPPKVCPGVRRGLVPDPDARRAVCPACGTDVRVRARTSVWTSGGVTLQRHPPGPDLVPPCPRHAWDHLTLNPAGAAVCACQLPEETTP